MQDFKQDHGSDIYPIGNHQLSPCLIFVDKASDEDYHDDEDDSFHDIFKEVDISFCFWIVFFLLVVGFAQRVTQDTQDHHNYYEYYT